MLKKVLGIFLVTMLFVSTGYALEVGKVNVPESITAGGSDLVLNGAGIRSKFGLKLYVGSLFLPRRAMTPRPSWPQTSPWPSGSTSSPA